MPRTVKPRSEWTPLQPYTHPDPSIDIPHRVVVFSKGKPDMTHTAEWFKRYNFNNATYVLSPEDKPNLRQYEKSTECKCVIADSHNLPSKRQWVLDHYTTPKSPWVLFFEDNIVKVTSVKPSHYDLPEIKPTNKPLYHEMEVGPRYVISKMLEDIRLAESIGAHFGGFACNDNHFFRSRKYRHIGYVWTKMAYMHRDGPPWPVELDEMDDYGYSAECLKWDGRVVINNYLYPWSKRYEGRGASRTLVDRLPDKRKAVELLHAKYPGLFRNRDDKKSCPHPGSEVTLRLHSEKQIDEWRQLMWDREIAQRAESTQRRNSNVDD